MSTPPAHTAIFDALSGTLIAHAGGVGFETTASLLQNPTQPTGVIARVERDANGCEHLLIEHHDGKHIALTAIPWAAIDPIFLERASRDMLTGALRKEFAQEHIVIALSEYHRHGHTFCLAFFDLDHFKQVNDTYGHLVGDELLRQVATFIRQRLRPYDVLVRFGGEEFLVLFKHTSLAKGIKAATRILEQMRTHPFVIGDLTLTQTTSVGLTTPQLADTPQTLIARADEAVYAAKRNGRNRLEYL